MHVPPLPGPIGILVWHCMAVEWAYRPTALLVTPLQAAIIVTAQLNIVTLPTALIVTVTATITYLT